MLFIQNKQSIFRQILPQSLLNDTTIITDDDYESVLSNAKQPIFLYMHGNSGNRASGHRVQLYQLFQTLDYHVICFDYRGESNIF